MQGDLLKLEHLADEEEAAPNTHNDVGRKPYQQEVTHPEVMPRQVQCQQYEHGDGHMHGNPESLQRYAGAALDDIAFKKKILCNIRLKQPELIRSVGCRA